MIHSSQKKRFSSKVTSWISVHHARAQDFDSKDSARNSWQWFVCSSAHDTFLQVLWMSRAFCFVNRGIASCVDTTLQFETKSCKAFTFRSGSCQPDQWSYKPWSLKASCSSSTSSTFMRCSWVDDFVICALDLLESLQGRILVCCDGLEAAQGESRRANESTCDCKKLRPRPMHCNSRVSEAVNLTGIRVPSLSKPRCSYSSS
jgi:hypothetical protein